MKAKIAVSTVSGRAYYLIVKELKRKKISFLSLTPRQRVPMEVKVVITTREEYPQIKHERVLTLENQEKPNAIVNRAIQIALGKERYEKIVVGVDPGEVFGLAVLADGEVFETSNCFSIEEIVDAITKLLENFKSDPLPSISVKIGDGVPKRRDGLLRALDVRLPSNVVLQSVKEAGTNRYITTAKHRRGLRDIISAVNIARRNGNTFSRRRVDESDS
ncbi:hypothetical protein GTO27_09660 [Candidatus Bathyarchaeota archaeon]|nr:hypothetical protein [Candidatus Bathyarchaeota archaeon]